MFFNHHGLDAPVDLYAESSGTKRLFHLLPQIGIAFDGGVPVALDEVEGDLHVDVARRNARLVSLPGNQLQ